MAKQFIQAALKGIKKHGTAGVCTGSNFGSETCPAGSKRYNLAVLFHRFAAERHKRAANKGMK